MTLSDEEIKAWQEKGKKARKAKRKGSEKSPATGMAQSLTPISSKIWACSASTLIDAEWDWTRLHPALEQPENVLIEAATDPTKPVTLTIAGHGPHRGLGVFQASDSRLGPVGYRLTAARFELILAGSSSRIARAFHKFDVCPEFEEFMSHSFDGRPILHQLCADAHSRGLVLFVGAGINAASARGWKDLMKSLVARASMRLQVEDAELNGDPTMGNAMEGWWVNHYDAYAAASIAKHVLRDEYGIALQSVLYGTASVEGLEEYCRTGAGNNSADIVEKGKYEYLAQVARLCHNSSVRAVVSFNYDCFLEQAIESVKVADEYRRIPLVKAPNAHRAFTDRIRPSNGSKQPLPIYHVHGFILPPGFARVPRDPAVVLAHNEYLAKMRAPTSWETSTPIHFLRNYCSLFLGVSFSDWNMFRLVEAAFGDTDAGGCYSLACKQDLGNTGTCPDFAAERLHATLLQAVGVRLIMAGDDYLSPPSFIGELWKLLEGRNE